MCQLPLSGQCLAVDDGLQRGPLGNCAFAALLRGSGALTKLLDDDGNTAGTLAVLSGCTEIARLLL